MRFNPISSHRARLFTERQFMPIALSTESQPVKHDIDCQTSKKVGDIVSMLKRYETNSPVPSRVQCSQSARRFLEMPLALLKAGVFSAPTSKPVPDSDYEHTSVPANRKIPRP